MFWGQAVELRLALEAAGEGGMARYPMRPHSLGVGATRAGDHIPVQNMPLSSCRHIRILLCPKDDRLRLGLQLVTESFPEVSLVTGSVPCPRKTACMVKLLTSGVVT